MKKFDESHKKIGDTDEQKIFILDKFPGIPINHENGTGDDDGEEFAGTVKHQIVIILKKIKAPEYNNPY